MPHTRPTTDIAKGGLFNIIENNLDIPSLKTLDIFGGTGSISYELASRGATDMTVVEKDPAMAAFISKTALSLGITGLKTVKMDAFKYLQQCTEKFDLIFADPPYMMETLDQLPLLVFEKELLNPEGWLVVEHTQHKKFQDYSYYRSERNYGATVFSIFINREELKRCPFTINNNIFMRTCLFPGTFDPITLGHTDVIDRGLDLFDRMVIAIGVNSSKTPMFALEERMAWIREIYKADARVEVASYSGLTIDFCKKLDARFILRGIRSGGDLEYERAIADANRTVAPGIETIFLTPVPQYSSIASTLVRDLYKYGGDVSAFLPAAVLEGIQRLKQ